MAPKSMRPFPPSWRVEQIDGGYLVKDANGQPLAYIYGRDTLVDENTASVLTMDEARFIASNIAKLPTLLTFREVSSFILKTIAVAVVIIIVTAFAAHFAGYYLLDVPPSTGED
jgi:hypothetical protein